MPDAEQDHYEALRLKYPRGKVCPQCGHLFPIEKFRVIGKPAPHKTPRVFPYCQDCEKEYTVHRNQLRSRRKAGIPRAKTAEYLDTRHPLPELEVGGRYRIIDKGRSWEGFEAHAGRKHVKVYDGIAVRSIDDGKRPKRWEFRYKLGNSGMEKTTIFNQGQLLFHTIIPVGEGSR